MIIMCSDCGNNIKVNRIKYVEIEINKDGSLKKTVSIMCTMCGRKILVDKLSDKVIKELNLGDDIWGI